MSFSIIAILIAIAAALRASRVANKADLGWMSAQWLNEHRASRQD
jgi:hypothetical protein